MRESQNHGCLCHVLHHQVHGFHCCDGGRGVDSWAPLYLDRHDCMPNCCCCPVLCGHRLCCSWEMGGVLATLFILCCYWNLWPVGSATTARDPRSQVPSLLSPLVPLLVCVLVHPSLNAQLWEIPQIPCVWGRDIFASCRLRVKKMECLMLPRCQCPSFCK